MFRDLLDSKNWSYEEIWDLLGRKPLDLMEKSLRFSARREVSRRLLVARERLVQARVQHVSAVEYAIVSDRHGDMGGNWAAQGAYKTLEEAQDEESRWRYLDSSYPGEKCPHCAVGHPGYCWELFGTSGYTVLRHCVCQQV